MPKDLQNKPGRADTKSTTKNCQQKNSLLKVSKVLAGKIVKKKNDTAKTIRKILHNNAAKLKVKKKSDIVVPIKTRSGACLVDSNVCKTIASKMKEKQKPAEKVKIKDDKAKAKKETGVKKSSYIAGNTVTTIKKDAKKAKNDKDEEIKKVKNTKKDDPDKKDTKADKTDDQDVTPPKKETKKEPAKKTPKPKKDDEKNKSDDKNKKEDELSKKDTKKEPKTKEDAKVTDKEKKTETVKKRPKKKDLETAKKDDDKSPSTDDKKDTDQPKKIKFFKSKSKKLDKTKEPSKKNDLKDAFTVYDNIDDDSDVGKPKKKEPLTKKVAKIGKETEIKIKQHLEEFKKSKLKRKLDVDDKRKADSESEADTKKCRKKMRKNVTEPDEDEVVKPKTKKQVKTLPKDDDQSSLSSDNVPLNKLVTKNTKARAAVKREPLSDSETDAKKCKTESPKKSKKAEKSPAKKAAPKAKKEDKTATRSTPKKVRFEKVTSKAPAKPARRRKQRMASLNAMAMVHCLYENESKSVSVSSYDSNSDYNVVTEVKRKPENTQVEVKSENKETALVKYEKEPTSPDPMINRESLRTGPGLRSVGKHWDMNSSSISSTLSDENIEMMAPPIVINEIVAIDKPKNALKKKFARALRRQVSEESSEEEKHQALLLEEKKRMVRRRRRQRKEITMDLKDMVVCKRMASLNATAILAASYSSSTGKRTITVKSSGKAEERRENVQNYEKPESVLAKMKNRKVPFTRKKFSSSSDADVEDEADLSGSEVVVKTASSSGKQQVSLIVNQDSGVTITGVYLNSTTKSTHHQGYCSISGMQYRISSTSHTQTEATTTTEAIVRTPQEPLRPPVSIAARRIYACEVSQAFAVIAKREKRTRKFARVFSLPTLIPLLAPSEISKRKCLP